MELKVEAKNLDIRKSWQEKIEEERNKLVRHYANFVLHLRVTIEATPGYKEGGHEVRLVASVPNDTVVVRRWGEKVRPLLTEAFDVLGSQLKEIVKKKQNHKVVKGMPSLAADGTGSGVVRKIIVEESYGFIASDEIDVFFHANVLKDAELHELSEGMEVLFAVEEGEKGPQAAWVRLSSTSV